MVILNLISTENFNYSTLYLLKELSKFNSNNSFKAGCWVVGHERGFEIPSSNLASCNYFILVRQQKTNLIVSWKLSPD